MAGEEEKASGRVIGRQRRDYFGPDNVLCSRWIFGENPFGFVACPGDHLVPLSLDTLQECLPPSFPAVEFKHYGSILSPNLGRGPSGLRRTI